MTTTLTWKPQLPRRDYLLWALLGLVAGWLAKLLQTLPEIKARATLLQTFGEKPTPAWLVVLVDALATLTIGAIVVIARNGGLPPDGSTWSDAIALGAGLGFLSRTDLVNRLPKQGQIQAWVREQRDRGGDE